MGSQGVTAKDVRIINYINIGSSSPKEPHTGTSTAIRRKNTSEEDNAGTGHVEAALRGLVIRATTPVSSSAKWTALSKI